LAEDFVGDPGAGETGGVGDIFNLDKGFEQRVAAVVTPGSQRANRVPRSWDARCVSAAAAEFDRAIKSTLTRNLSGRRRF